MVTVLRGTRHIGQLTGEPGISNSTTLRRLREDPHPEQIRLLYLQDTAVSPRDFCGQIAFEQGIQPHVSRARTLRTIHKEIRWLTTERRLTALLVGDEAQSLRYEVLALLPTLLSCHSRGGRQTTTHRMSDFPCLLRWDSREVCRFAGDIH